MPLSRIVAIVVSSVAVTGLTVSIPVRADDRLAVPTSEDLAKAQANVKEVFKSDFAKTKLADRRALAAKLYQQGKATTDDANARYVLLLQARDIAAKNGDPSIAMFAADELVSAYQVPPAETRSVLVAPLLAASTTTTIARSTAEVLLAAADTLWSEDQWPAVIELLNGAERAAVLAKSTPLGNAAASRLKRAVLLKAEAGKVSQHLDTLKTNPDDADANLAVGRYTFFVRHNLEGMANLAKGPDSKLKVVAEMEIKASSGTDADKVALGDTWYGLLAETDPVTKLGAQTRALYWYQMALADLKGLSKTKTEKHVAELQAIVDANASTQRWYAIRRAIVDQEIKKWNTVGGGFSKIMFEEIPAEGAILIGFVYTTTPDGKYPATVQPIFLTSHGEVLGKEYGQVKKGTEPLKVKAKPGYAVGALYTRGGGGIDAIKPIFMRITEKGLDINDKYEPPQIGGNGGGAETFGGDGQFIVGLHGKVTDKGGPAAISVVTIAPKK